MNQGERVLPRASDASISTTLPPCDGPLPPSLQRWFAKRQAAWTFALLAALSASEVKPFTGNQQTYLAHAVARLSPSGPLAGDWFVHTRDPVPLFTLLVMPLLWLGSWALACANSIVGALFLFALARIMVHFRQGGRSLGPSGAREAWLVSATACMAVAWALIPGAMRSLLFDGLAEQRAYSTYLQPSNAGVLLLCAVWFALERHSSRAVLLAAAAVWLHPTYASCALIFTVGVCVADARWARNTHSWIVSGVSGLAMVPPILQSLRAFAPTSSALAARASQVLVSERLPHHALASHWFSPVGLLHLLPIIVMLRSSAGRERTLLVVWASLSALLSGLVVLSARPELMLLFPWRSTIWLVPASLAMLCGKLWAALARRSTGLDPFLERRWVPVCAASLLAICTVRVAQGAKVGAPEDFQGVALAQRIRLADRERWTLLIPVTWEGVRLNAPAAVYVDFKSHPYKDGEVLGWRERLSDARKVYAGLGDCALLSRLLENEPRIGFVLAPPADDFRSCQVIHPSVRDADGTLYAVRGRTFAE